MQTGLYHPSEFKDNCGFGLVAQLEGEASHKLLKKAIESLTCMTHRGGIAADGKTGDGCGLLLQKPDAFLRQVALADSITLPRLYGVGMVFLSEDTDKAKSEKKNLEQALIEEDLDILGWRDVPIDPSCCGEIALQSLPSIAQLFVGAKEFDEKTFNVKLFLARKKAEKALEEDDEFYVCSLSSTVISYKGLMMPADLPVFYKDLADPRLQTAICVFHQRFSTNTLPRWPLAQPFRLLAHNGEINTIMGNRNWSEARETKFASEHFPDIDSITPLVNREGSDSSSLDNMLEVLLNGGMDMFRAIRMVIPPAWQNVETMDADLKAFYEYNSMHMEPWDGPAGIVLTDGRYAACLLDRNGLRPSRYVITKDGFLTVASEIGTHRYKPEEVLEKGRIGPGQILAVDTKTGKVLHTDDIDNRLKTRQPYKKWLRENTFRIRGRIVESSLLDLVPAEQLNTYMKLHQVSFEERDQVLRPMAENGQEAVGSMGDDTPVAALSRTQRSVHDYFRQQFAQVTNPPIDPLRESIVMSLETCLGAEENIFTEKPEHAKRVILNSPVLSPSKFFSLMHLERSDFQHERISLAYNPNELSLREALEKVVDQAEAAVKNNKVLLVLSDRDISEGRLLIPSLMATGAVHHRLIDKGLRCNANIIVKTGSARDPHQIATLFGFGATAVYPYLSYSVLDDLINTGEIIGTTGQVFKKYRKALNKGLMKILSKMGISTIASYRGAQLFEAVGLGDDITNLCFKGVSSRIGGASFSDIEADTKVLSAAAFSARKPIAQGGLLKYVHGGEYHAYNPDVVTELQRAVQYKDYSAYKRYADLVNKRPVATLRDLFALKSVNSIDISEVEPLEAIFPRFDSAGMSLGALSPEAHEALAVAMNRLGSRSNSGEGGEDPKRYGTERMSKIKQIASGRFGVTPHYLVNAEVLQIKVAQGAKPGEGGQLPGGKVNPLIARLRFSVPGVTLISPPPHHDIYSIEDLAQLIFDLKQVNPTALVSVKLVSESGVGTIAAGVAKAYADLITISGYDGGTAASPLSSIHHAGSPWELGLSEVHQALRSNGLRHKVRVQTDGGLKTGLDVVKAAILGAESFGFGTAPMVALGCKYLRICHLNNCATGVATQNEHLRDEHFIGTVEMVVNFFHFIGEETREWLAFVGVPSLEALIGRTDLLDILPGETTKQNNLNLTPILFNDYVPVDAPQFCSEPRNTPFDKGLTAEAMLDVVQEAIVTGKGGEFSFEVVNCDRSIGARLSGEIARHHAAGAMADTPLVLHLSGTAGQSFGAWNAEGLQMYLEGDANDYVGKGMAGGQLVIFPPHGSSFASQKTAIIGNTCLYGATGGTLYAAGCAGERFAVRNSGATAVVEGVGDHCCEYMTGGVVTVLGETGYNFGAGMTGGFAYVLDESRQFIDRYNRELVELFRVSGEALEAHRAHLHSIIEDYVAETQSEWGRELLENFDDYIGKFWLVKPKAANIDQLLRSTRSQPE